MEVVNLRQKATHRLLNSLNIRKAPADFSHRAVSCIRSLVDGGERPVGLGGAGVDTTRVFAYAEYNVVPVGGIAPCVDGHLFRESGLRGSACIARSVNWLHSFQLPNSSHVDRSLCAEFQVLAELCGVLSPEGGKASPRDAVVGVLFLFTTCSPCMSCVSAIRQFQVLFPEVALETSEYDDIACSSL